jgi:rfaE bifunctional protein nucleotidyltransferase chain/domain
MVASLTEVAERIRKAQLAGKRVVFTNGCFDILHSGHVDLLRRARDLGDVLVVAINSDGSIARIKGRHRPIIPERERAELLDGLEMVDFVCWFEDDTPLQAILAIRPDILVKGADWTDNVVGQPEVEGWGGKVFNLPLVKGHSTTGIVDRVLARYGNSRKTNT